MKKNASPSAAAKAKNHATSAAVAPATTIERAGCQRVQRFVRSPGGASSTFNSRGLEAMVSVPQTSKAGDGEVPAVPCGDFIRAFHADNGVAGFAFDGRCVSTQT